MLATKEFTFTRLTASASASPVLAAGSRSVQSSPMTQDSRLRKPSMLRKPQQNGIRGNRPPTGPGAVTSNSSHAGFDANVVEVRHPPGISNSKSVSAMPTSRHSQLSASPHKSAGCEDVDELDHKIKSKWKWKFPKFHKERPPLKTQTSLPEKVTTSTSMSFPTTSPEPIKKSVSYLPALRSVDQYNSDLTSIESAASSLVNSPACMRSASVVSDRSSSTLRSPVMPATNPFHKPRSNSVRRDFSPVTSPPQQQTPQPGIPASPLLSPRYQASSQEQNFASPPQQQQYFNDYLPIFRPRLLACELTTPTSVDSVEARLLSRGGPLSPPPHRRGSTAPLAKLDSIDSHLALAAAPTRELTMTAGAPVSPEGPVEVLVEETAASAAAGGGHNSDSGAYSEHEYAATEPSPPQTMESSHYETMESNPSSYEATAECHALVAGLLSREGSASPQPQALLLETSATVVVAEKHEKQSAIRPKSFAKRPHSFAGVQIPPKSQQSITLPVEIYHELLRELAAFRHLLVKLKTTLSEDRALPEEFSLELFAAMDENFAAGDECLQRVSTTSHISSRLTASDTTSYRSSFADVHDTITEQLEAMENLNKENAEQAEKIRSLEQTLEEKGKLVCVLQNVLVKMADGRPSAAASTQTSSSSPSSRSLVTSTQTDLVVSSESINETYDDLLPYLPEDECVNSTQTEPSQPTPQVSSSTPVQPVRAQQARTLVAPATRPVTTTQRGAARGRMPPSSASSRPVQTTATSRIAEGVARRAVTSAYAQQPVLSRNGSRDELSSPADRPDSACSGSSRSSGISTSTTTTTVSSKPAVAAKPPALRYAAAPRPAITSVPVVRSPATTGTGMRPPSSGIARPTGLLLPKTRT